MLIVVVKRQRGSLRKAQTKYKGQTFVSRKVINIQTKTIAPNIIHNSQSNSAKDDKPLSQIHSIFVHCLINTL